MFEADKKLKLVEAAIDKFLRRIAEVNRDNEELVSLLKTFENKSDP